MSSVPSQSFEEFRYELLKRFFNPKSYFFLCLSTQLQDGNELAADLSEDDYLIVGQVIQHLVDAENPGKTLRELGELGRLHDFNQNLEEAMQQLRTPGMEPEEMKRVIEAAANDLVDSLIDVLHDETACSRLRDMLHLPMPATRAPAPDVAPEIDLPAQSSPPLEDALEAELARFEDTVDSLHLPDELDSPPALELDPSVADREFGNEMASGGLPDVSRDAAEIETMPADDVLQLGDFAENTLPAPAEEDAEPAGEPHQLADDAVLADGDEPAGTPSSDAAAAPQGATHALQPEKAAAAASPVPAAQAAEHPAAAGTVETGEKEETARAAGGASTEPAVNPQEPGGLQQAFYAEAQAHLEQVRRLLPTLPADRFPRKKLKELREVFLCLRESGMIHGFGEIEDLALKTQKLTEKLLREQRPLEAAAVTLLTEIPDAIALALTDAIDVERAKTLRRIAIELNDALRLPAQTWATPEADEYRGPAGEAPDDRPAAAEHAPPPQVAAPAQPLATPQEKSAPATEEAAPALPVEAGHTGPDLTSPAKGNGHSQNDFDEVTAEMETLFAEDINELEGEYLPQSLDDDLTETAEFSADEIDLSLKLPGEDDPKLLELIREVSDSRFGTEPVTAAPEEATGAHSLAEQPQKPAAFAAAPAAPPIHDERIATYRQEAELYFRVVDEAVAALQRDPTSRISLENLELAAYSLKGLARKLGLEPFARFPGLAEELLGKLIIQQKSCSEETFLTIQKGFRLLRDAADISEVEKSESREVDKYILRLISSVEKDSTLPNDDRAAFTPTDTGLNLDA